MDKKLEPRIKANLTVRIFGMDSAGRTFSQNIHAVDLSSAGAKLADIEHAMAPGDVIGVQYADKKARFRVVWVIEAGGLNKTQAGIEMVEGQVCPWQEELANPEAVAASEIRIAAQNKRRYPRHKIQFPIEIFDPRGRGARLHTNATDISGRGCYVQTLMPLPLGTPLNITYWMDDQKVETTGIVSASDGGVGMGIDFTGLDVEGQERLRDRLEELDPLPPDEEVPEEGS